MKKVLYLGTDIEDCWIEGEIEHCPLIDLQKKSFTPLVVAEIAQAEHIVLTSKKGIQFFFEQAKDYPQIVTSLQNKTFWVIGEKSAGLLLSYGFSSPYLPSEETQEGLASLLIEKIHSGPKIVLGQSNLARLYLAKELKNQQHSLFSFILYTNNPSEKQPLYSTDLYTDILFTSPSTVHAFYARFGRFPSKVHLHVRGRITYQALNLLLPKQDVDRIKVFLPKGEML